MTSVLPNLAALLQTYAFFPGSRYSDGLPGIALFDGGTASAYENYALIDPKKMPDSRPALRSLVRASLGFFSVRGMPHIWPLFPGASPAVGALLEECGAVRDGFFFDMSARTDAMAGYAPEKDAFDTVCICDPGSARAWADAVWYGFDSEACAPDSFVRFARGMIRSRELLLCAVCDRDAPRSRIAATGMLALAGGTAGAYYVATRPEYRRRGLGRRAMKALLDAANARGTDRVALLATPSGRPLYEACGFAAAGDVEIYRLGEA